MRAPCQAALLAVALAAALMLQGCGAGSPPPSPTAAPTTEAPTEAPPPTCGEGISGTDFCCPMPSSQASCAETACGQLFTMEEGKLWTAVAKGPVEDANYIGPPHNRMVIMVLDAGVAGHTDKSLVLVNAIPLSAGLRDELKQLEQDQNATVRYVVSTGDWHWLFLGEYLTPFPSAAAYVPPGRIPNEQTPQFAYTVLNISAPLEELRPGLEIHNMDGLIQPPLGSYNENSSRNELFFYHAASKTLVAGDLIWVWSCEPTDGDKATWGATKGALTIWNYGGNSIWSAKASEILRAKASAQLLLALDFTRFIPIHGSPGNMVPPDANPDAKALFDSALKGPFGILPSMQFMM